MNREWTAEDELRHENRRLAAEVAELRVRAEAAEAWCESWKRGAGISSRERDEARAALRELVRLKAIKDDLTLTEIDDPQVRDYERSKPAAWAEARRIVG